MHLEAPEIIAPISTHIHKLRRVPVHGSKPRLTTNQFPNSLQAQPGELILLSIVPTPIARRRRSVLSIAVSQSRGLIVVSSASYWFCGSADLNLCRAAYYPRPRAALNPFRTFRISGLWSCFSSVISIRICLNRCYGVQTIPFSFSVHCPQA